jgi:hypothetical protein
MVISIHLQREAVVAIPDCADRGQFIGSRSLKQVAPQSIWLFQESPGMRRFTLVPTAMAERQISLERFLWSYWHARPNSSLGAKPHEVYIEVVPSSSRPELTMSGAGTADDHEDADRFEIGCGSRISDIENRRFQRSLPVYAASATASGTDFESPLSAVWRP